MKQKVYVLAAVLLAANGLEAHEEYLPEIIVPGQRGPDFSHVVRITGADKGLSSTDTARLLTVIPGADYNDNGPLSGQAQYRGMFGPRMNVTVDGVAINSGGPNWMDPPLHYVPSVLLSDVQLTRGIASVSDGAGIGGDIAATTLDSSFGDSDSFALNGRIKLSGHTVDDGYNAGGIVSAASNRQRLHLLGSYEAGGNREFGDGTIAATEYRRAFAGAGYGVRLGGQAFSLDYRRSETGDSGNPVLPLDIDFLDTDLVRLQHEGRISDFDVHTRISYTHVDHRMTNYHLRPAPDISSLPLPPFQGTDRRFVNARSSGLGYRLHVSRALANGELDLGADGRLDENRASVGDPDFEPFFVDNYNDATTDTWGFFSQWRGTLSRNLNLEIGLRYERIETGAGPVDAQPANLPMAAMPGTPPFAVRMLRDRFNALDRNRGDDNIDWVVKLNYDLTKSTSIELGLARKTRSPSYIERYSWIPLEVNAGLGDGNNYVGDVALEPEVSHQAELGVEWQTSQVYFTPRFYYRRVDDYIQGVPATDMFVRAVSGNANGDPDPLRFANVDAEIYGFDAMYGLRLNDQWRLDGTLSYTRGKRRDIDDDLYRISPLHTRLSLNYRAADWSATVEGVAYASQHHVSAVITGNSAIGSTAPVPGYVIANLSGQYDVPGTGLTLQAGIENLLDRDYVDPLAGFNRVSGSDIPVGARLHGPGRNAYATLAWKW